MMLNCHYILGQAILDYHNLQLDIRMGFQYDFLLHFRDTNYMWENGWTKSTEVRRFKNFCPYFKIMSLSFNLYRREKWDFWEILRYKSLTTALKGNFRSFPFQILKLSLSKLIDHIIFQSRLSMPFMAISNSS